MFKIFTVIFIALFFSSCVNKYEPLPTVQKVDIQKYLGKWYEIARFEHYFEKDCKNVSANYSINEDSSIKVLNSCEDINSGEKKVAEGIAYADDPNNTRLKVSFFRPFYGDYWILELDDEYKYALVGEPSREYLWILSREKTIDKSLKDTLLKKAQSLGFDTSKLLWTVQDL